MAEVKIDREVDGGHPGWKDYYFRFNGHLPIRLQTIDTDKERCSYIYILPGPRTGRAEISGIPFSQMRVEGILTPEAVLDIIIRICYMIAAARDVGYNEAKDEIKTVFNRRRD